MEHHRYFVYLCFTVMTGLFAIEIGQKITERARWIFHIVGGCTACCFAIYTVYRVAVLPIRVAAGRVRTRHRARHGTDRKSRVKRELMFLYFARGMIEPSVFADYLVFDGLIKQPRMTIMPAREAAFGWRKRTWQQQLG
ncbi:MAG: hypothetical protein ACLTBF_11025 [Christensenellales bacterium]